jgi:hypothetical protein
MGWTPLHAAAATIAANAASGAQNAAEGENHLTRSWLALLNQGSNRAAAARDAARAAGAYTRPLVSSTSALSVGQGARLGVV